jgi:glycosyltransferase involved in cell wall biosynthesis
MKILHFVLGKANKNRANGVNQVVAGIAKYCIRNGADVRVIGMASSVEEQGSLIFRDGFVVEAYSRWSFNFYKELINAIQWANIIHLHGVYSPWNVYIAQLCKKNKRPYVITLHNGLSDNHLIGFKKVKKIIFHKLLQEKYLLNSSAIHVLTEEESTDLLKYISPKRICLIPNGIDLEDYSITEARTDNLNTPIRVGYLGRISPEKNIDSLCDVFRQINYGKKMQLVIAGPSSDYLNQLTKKYSEYGVVWVGPKYGEEKIKFIKSLDIFVHPSLCDVFSISAMEVLAAGTPLLITRTSNASYFYNTNSFFMCEPTPFGIQRGLELALHNKNKWPDMSENGRRLVAEFLNWNSVAKKMLASYELLISK